MFVIDTVVKGMRIQTKYRFDEQICKKKKETVNNLMIEFE